MANFSEAVSLYMNQPVNTVAPEATLEEIEETLQTHQISSVAVVDQNGLCGVVSRTDLLRLGTRQSGRRPDANLLDLPRKTASEVMSQTLVSVLPQTSLREAASQMKKHQMHRVYVISQSNSLVGVLSTYDLMLAVRDVRPNKVLSNFMSSPVFTIRANEPLSLATERLEKAHVSGLVVLDDEWPVGIFTQREALLYRSFARDTPVEGVMSSSLLILPPYSWIYRAAAQAFETKVRRILVMEGKELRGIMTGLDFAEVVL